MISADVGSNSRPYLAVIALGTNFERAGVFLIFFSDLISRAGPLAFFVAATLVVIPVAYFDVNTIVGACFQICCLSCN